MNDNRNSEDMTNPGDAQRKNEENASLARWLQQVLQSSIDEELSMDKEESDSQLELLVKNNYHLTFYQQLPDFVMSLLTNDPLATTHYAPLLFHMVSCRTCHETYLDLYSSMRAAINPQEARPVLGQGPRSLASIPHRMLGHLCRSLISQAEAILRQSRHDHNDRDVAARSLLQLAVRVSAPISQGTIRQQALQDLVRVATLFDDVQAADDGDPNVKKYTPVMAGPAGVRRGKTPRYVNGGSLSAERQSAVIQLQSQSLEGSIVQNGQMLELHLHDLAASLRGHFVSISVLLGSLLEPVRWLGGNPGAIRSTEPVNELGTLITPVGSTELELSNPEERNLLEAMFMLLEIRPLDEA